MSAARKLDYHLLIYHIHCTTENMTEAKVILLSKKEYFTILEKTFCGSFRPKTVLSSSPIYGILSPVYGILDWVPYMGLWIPSTGFKSHIWDSESRRRDSNKNPIDGNQVPIYGILKSHIWDSESRLRDSESQFFFWIYSVERALIMLKFVRCTTRDLKVNSLKVSA